MRYYILGLAKSGIAACYWALANGHEVYAADNKEESSFAEEVISDLKAKGVSFAFGADPDIDKIKPDRIIVTPAIPYDRPYLVKAREQGIDTTNEIQLGFETCKAPIIGVTGSNGKTTTTSLIGHILKGMNPKTFVGGNIGNPFAKESLTIEETTPVVLELSSFQLESVDDFVPAIGVLLNYSPDHLDRHHSYENYCNAKWRITEHMTPLENLIVNYDDTIVRKKTMELLARGRGPVITFFTTHHLAANVVAGTKWIWLDKNQDIIYEEMKIMNVSDFHLPGKHNVENLMAAIAAAITYGVPNDVIVNQVKSFKPVEHRLETVKTLEGVTYVNDSKATNIDAAIKALDSFTAPIVLIAGGHGKGAPYDDLAKKIKAKCRAVVLIGEEKDKIGAALDEAGFDSYIKIDSFEEAVKKCKELAHSGDVVLLAPACSSFDMFTCFEQRGEIFKNLVKGL